MVYVTIAKLLHGIRKYNLMDWLVKDISTITFNIFFPSLKEPPTRRDNTNLMYEIRFDAETDYKSFLSNTSSEKYQEMVSNLKPRVRFKIIM